MIDDWTNRTRQLVVGMYHGVRDILRERRAARASVAAAKAAYERDKRAQNSDLERAIRESGEG